MNKTAKNYLLGMGSSMVIAYPIVLFTSITLLKQYPDAAWRPIVAVAPVIPILFGLRAFLRALNQMDELQRRIQLNAIAFAAGATGMVTVTYGFLENAGFPQLSWIWIFPMLIALWGISLPIVGRRYR